VVRIGEINERKGVIESALDRQRRGLEWDDGGRVLRTKTSNSGSLHASIVDVLEEEEEEEAGREPEGGKFDEEVVFVGHQL
jgi:hypothetical protein